MKKIALGIMTIFVWVAQINIAAACASGFHEPKIPSQLSNLE